MIEDRKSRLRSNQGCSGLNGLRSTRSGHFFKWAHRHGTSSDGCVVVFSLRYRSEPLKNHPKKTPELYQDNTRTKPKPQQKHAMTPSRPASPAIPALSSFVTLVLLTSPAFALPPKSAGNLPELSVDWLSQEPRGLPDSGQNEVSESGFRISLPSSLSAFSFGPRSSVHHTENTGALAHRYSTLEDRNQVDFTKNNVERPGYHSSLNSWRDRLPNSYAFSRPQAISSFLKDEASEDEPALEKRSARTTQWLRRRSLQGKRARTLSINNALMTLSNMLVQRGRDRLLRNRQLMRKHMRLQG